MTDPAAPQTGSGTGTGTGAEPTAAGGASVPLESAPKSAGAAGAGVALAGGGGSEPRSGIRWSRLFVIAVPIALLLLGGWYMTTRSDMARRRAKAQLPEKALQQYPNQPEVSFGYWRRLLDDPASDAASKTDAQVAVQKLIDSHGLHGRLEDLIAVLLRQGESDFVQSRSYAETLLYLDTHFKTKETVEQGRTRVEHLEAIRSGYADALNDKTVRAQLEKALEKMTALYALYPEADFIRPTVARMQVEVADALIGLDQLEDSVRRLEIAIKLDPQPLYMAKLNMLKSDIEKLDPSAFLEKARAAEASGDREEAQAQYEAALRNRRSNQEARDGYTRLLKFYAEIFMRNIELNNGELDEDGERFCKLAAKNGKLMAQYGDESLILAKAELMLAENDFLQEDFKAAKEFADTGINSIALAQRATPEGSYLMAKAFKLYYHLGKNMGKIPEAKQALQLADQYCRLAMEKNHPLASRLFVQVQNLEQTEQEDATVMQAGAVTAPVDSAGSDRDVRDIVNEGPLSAGAPVDGLQVFPERGVAAPQGAGEGAASSGPQHPPQLPPDHNPELNKLLNPLR